MDQSASRSSSPSAELPPRRRLRFGLALAGLGLASLAALTPACRTPVANRSPLGEVLPSVEGTSLAGDRIALPADLAGGPAVLLLGFVQDAQFDADRWLFGLLQAETPARILEVPTIPGLAASWFGDRIDAGRRTGIPDEDWGTVVTVYGDGGSRLVDLTGNEGPRNVRVLLVDATGTVRWFHDRGFSAGKLLELDRAARDLAAD